MIFEIAGYNKCDGKNNLTDIMRITFAHSLNAAVKLDEHSVMYRRHFM